MKKNYDLGLAASSVQNDMKPKFFISSSFSLRKIDSKNQSKDVYHVKKIFSSFSQNGIYEKPCERNL